MDTETEGPKTTRSVFERNTKYEKPEVEERVVSLRDDGKTWEEITEIVSGEINEPRMSKTLSQTIYNRAMAKTITTEKLAGNKIRDFSKELGSIQGEAIKVLDGYIKAAKFVSKELLDMVEKGNIEAVKAYGIILKTAPQMKAITSEIRDYIKLHIDQQDKIKIEEKALVWSEGQMMDYMDKYLNQLEKEGKIRWIKPKLV